MRSLTKKHPQVVAAYALIIVMTVLGLARVQQVASQNNDARKGDHTQFCAVSIKRWQVQWDVIATVTEHIPNPATNDAATRARVDARNRQLDGQRDRLFVELGPEPKPC